ncbi:MAG: copper resistance protein CopC [Actinomycetota bacterium]|nr:copper resistance protein CopC [Actinomycetota bacterium]
MRYLRFLLAALAVGAWAAGPLAGAAGAGAAAPTYQSSDPERGAMMDHPPSDVTVTFSEPLDASSEMSVFDECGRAIDSGPATVELNEMQVGIGKTPSGTYKVVYTAVGLAGLTGKTNGSFDFMVHHGKPCKKGGAHGNHDGHDEDKGDGNGHGNHANGNGGGGDDHDGHDAMDDSGAAHPGTHSSGTMHGGGHMGSGNGGGRDGGHGNHNGDGTNDRPGGGTAAENPNPPVASGPGGGAATADAQAMLIGLGLALLVGVFGGWLLRNTGGPAGAA